MTPLRSMPVLLAVLICALLAGCAHKKTVLVMPQEAPPATAPTPAPAPQAQQQEPAEPQPQPTPAAESGQAQNEPPVKNSSKAKPHPAKKQAQPAENTAHATKPRVIQNETVPAAVTPAPSPEVASQQAATEKLLQSTENAIKGITRQLSPDEQAMLAQIRDFMNQSRSATKDNDFARAHNLAIKAHLLSDELVKQK